MEKTYQPYVAQEFFVHMIDGSTLIIEEDRRLPAGASIYGLLQRSKIDDVLELHNGVLIPRSNVIYMERRGLCQHNSRVAEDVAFYDAVLTDVIRKDATEREIDELMRARKAALLDEIPEADFTVSKNKVFNSNDATIKNLKER